MNGTTKVLIVDDEEAILESTAAVLRLFGIEVATESDAAKIIDRIRVETPDVLLQDVRMPDFNVEDHVRSIRADPKLSELPIIIFSAYVDAHEIARRVGADGAIAKPFEPDELITVIDDVRGGGQRGRKGGDGAGPDAGSLNASPGAGLSDAGRFAFGAMLRLLRAGPKQLGY